MLLAVVICAFAVAATVSGQDCAHTSCNVGLIKYYKELNCIPVQESGACCPSKFDCTAVLSNRPKNKCHVGGRAYEIGATLTQEQIGNKCVAECRCMGTESVANLNCANIECPEHMGLRPPPGCSYVYTHDSCCSVGVVCNNATTRSAGFTCAHAGHSHQLGEKFYPDEKPCMECICQEGYDGTIKEPWCKEISCGIEVHNGEKIHEGCAPIHYSANGCCPIDWRCPKASDTVEKPADALTTGSAECVFGDLRLKIGEKLNSEKSCVECKCTLPPQVTCVQTGHC